MTHKNCFAYTRVSTVKQGDGVSLEAQREAISIFAQRNNLTIIDWFEENFQIVDLQECQRRISSGFNTRPTLSITFDDGYSENCDFALPLLIERRIPVTYFVTTSNIFQQKPFAHDVEAGFPLPVNTIGR